MFDKIIIKILIKKQRITLGVGKHYLFYAIRRRYAMRQYALAATHLGKFEDRKKEHPDLPTASVDFSQVRV